MRNFPGPQGCLSIGWIGLGLLLLGGCAREISVLHSAAPPPAVYQTMRRQIRNAVDAGEGDTLVRELRQRVTTHPDDIQARLDLAARYQQQGFPELAIEHYRLAAARAPHLSGVRMLLARALHAQGADTEAIETLVTFCKLDPTAPVELISLLGIYEDQEGLYEEAEARHRAAIALAPQRDFLYNNLGYNLLLQGKAAQAAVELRHAVALNPRSEIARNNLGTALALSGNPREALLHWQSVSGPATAHNNLASVWMEQKNYAEARREIEIALGYSRNHAAALGNLALLAELDGRPASVPVQRRVTARQRVALGLHKVFSGAKSELETGAGPATVPTASK